MRLAATKLVEAILSVLAMNCAVRKINGQRLAPGPRPDLLPQFKPQQCRRPFGHSRSLDRWSIPIHLRAVAFLAGTTAGSPARPRAHGGII